MGRMLKHAERDISKVSDYVDLSFLMANGLEVKRVAKVLPRDFFGYIMEVDERGHEKPNGILVYLPATYWSDLSFDTAAAEEVK